MGITKGIGIVPLGTKNVCNSFITIYYILLDQSSETNHLTDRTKLPPLELCHQCGKQLFFAMNVCLMMVHCVVANVEPSITFFYNIFLCVTSLICQCSQWSWVLMSVWKQCSLSMDPFSLELSHFSTSKNSCHQSI